MKKFLFLASSLVIAGITSFGQMSVEPELGLNISNMRQKGENANVKTFDAGLGFNAGVGLKYDLGEWLYLKPGLYYHHHNTTLINMDKVKESMSTHYLQLPIALGASWSLNDGKWGSVFGEVAPYIGYALAGQFKTINDGSLAFLDYEEPIEWGNNLNESNPLDYGAKFAIGYQLPMGIYFKGAYNLGLANMNNTDIQLNQRSWNVNIGYSIKL